MLLLLLLLIPPLASLASLVQRKKRWTLECIAVNASLAELAIAIGIASRVLHEEQYSLNDYFSVDALGTLILLMVTVIGVAVSAYSVGYLREEISKGIIGFHRVRQYYVLLHLFIAAMLFAITTPSPVIMWIAIEATTLATAFLISFYNKPSAMEAAWKYLLINSVGLLIAFWGTLLFLIPVMGQGAHESIVTWRTLVSHAVSNDPAIVRIAFILILIGYGTKIGLVPMHTWLPDAHSKAPAPISGLLSGVLLNVAFLAMLRFKSVADIALGSYFSRELLIFFGVISILVATFLIFSQKNYKRLLAYSSIEHMGIIALGFGFGGIGSFAALLHMMYHSLAKSILFLSSGNIFLKYSSNKMAEIRGTLSRLPWTSVIAFMGFLALAGIPPFGTFFTEFSILSSGIGRYPVITSIALSSFVLIFIGFLRHMALMMYEKAPDSIPQGEAEEWTVAPLLFLLILLIVFGIFLPPPLLSLIQRATIAH